MTTAPSDRPFDSGPHYANLAEADAVVRLALEVRLSEEVVYGRVKAKAEMWGLSATQAAQRILLAERAQLAPEW